MNRVFFVLFFACSLCVPTAFAGSNLWQEIGSNNSRQINREQNLPDAYRIFSLDQKSMKNLLRQAPEEFTTEAASQPLILTLPMPDGSLERFRVEHSLVVEPELAAKYPELSQTYRGQGIDDPTATVRFDFLPSGFHSMIRSLAGTVLIDPYIKGETEDYIAYFKRDANSSENFACNFKGDPVESLLSTKNTGKFDSKDLLPDIPAPDAPSVSSGTTLRTYRLALAATGEYTAAVGGGTVAGALAAQVLIMNRVNGVYERDVAVHMNIIANNNLIVYTNGATDPYTNDDGFTLLGENQSNIDAVIGTANYDIGHVFSTGGGGVAQLRAPCSGSKAQGVTGLPNPVGDAFAIDYVAHEMGHQFGGNHTFNGTVGSCGGGNRAASAAYEPGSGITIMAYAGICGNQDLARNSIDTFHVRSLEEITTFINNAATGGSCSVNTPTGNTVPTVATAGATTYTIPKTTPFTLSAVATDANNDSITYDWQEYDRGASTTTVPNTDATGGARPIFRPYLPTTGGSRTFPSLQYILNNANVPPASFNCGRTTDCLTGELLPAIARTMVFQVVARDNRSGGGGINTASVSVIVDAASGPFVVTSPNTNVSWNAGSTQAVTWNVANTTSLPVNAANVNIKLSTDGGQTFPTTLVANTANDGTENIVVPNVGTTTARIRVESANNIFFDVSDANFAIALSPTAAGVSVNGRVLTAGGKGISRARVSMTDQQGEIVTVLTNSFGYYHFDNVPAGTGYVFSITDKRYKFDTSIVSLTDNLEDCNFTALP